MRSQRMQPADVQRLLPSTLFSTVQRAAPAPLASWCKQNGNLWDVFLYALRPLAYTIEDGLVCPSIFVASEHWADWLHAFALAWINHVERGEFAEFVTRMFDSANTISAIWEKMVTLQRAYDARYGRFLRLSVGVLINGRWALVHIPGMSGQSPHLRIYQGITYEELHPLPALGLHVEKLTIQLHAMSVAWSEGSGSFSTFEGLGAPSVLPIRSAARGSSTSMDGAKDEVISNLKRKGWRYTTGDKTETLAHPDGHFKVLFRERTVRAKSQSWSMGGFVDGDWWVGDFKQLHTAHGQNLAAYLQRLADRSPHVTPPVCSESEWKRAVTEWRVKNPDVMAYTLESSVPARYGYDAGKAGEPDAIPEHFKTTEAENWKTGYQIGVWARNEKAQKILTAEFQGCTLTWKEGEGLFLEGLDASAKWMKEAGLAFHWSPARKLWMRSNTKDWDAPDYRFRSIAEKIQRKLQNPSYYR